MYSLLFWISVQLVLLWLLFRLSRPYRNRRWFKLTFAPSSIVDNQIRLGSCCLSGKTVDRVSFFEDRKPFLSEGPSRFVFFGELLYLVLWQSIVFYVFYRFATSWEGVDAHATALPHVDPGQMADGVVSFDARAYLDGLFSFFATLQWGSWWTWLFLYVSVGLFPCLAIDFRQLQRGAIVVAFCALVTAAFIFLGIRPGFLSRGWWISGFVLPEFFRVYSLYLSFLGLTVIGHIAVRLSWEALCWQTRSAVKARERRKATEKREASKPRKKQLEHA